MKRLGVKLALLLMLVPSLASALSTNTYHINASCANNGDGSTSSCAASGGAPGACNDAESCIEGKAANLVSADKIYEFQLEGSTSDTIDTINTDSYTTDSTRYIKITTIGANRPSGVWDTGKPRWFCNGYYGCIDVQESVWIDGVQMGSDRSLASSGAGAGVFTTQPIASSLIKVTNSIIRFECVSSCTASDQNAGIYIENGNSVSSLRIEIANNIIYNFAYFGITIKELSSASQVNVLYNNTLIDNVEGQINLSLYGTSDAVYMYNNILQSSTDTGNNLQTSSTADTYNHDYNITEDSSSPDASYQSKTVTFNNEGSDDFRLGSGDTVAKDLGTSMAADGQYAFSTDIAGTTRPSGSSWDIGAFEYVAAGGSFKRRRNLMNGGFQDLNGGM